MTNLTSRVISALLALGILFGVAYFFKVPGTAYLCTLIAIVGIYEMSLLLFKDGFPRFAKTVFFTVSGLNLMISTTAFFPFQYITLVFSFILVSVGGLIFHRHFKSIETIFLFVSQFMMGLIYASILPALVISILKSNNGVLWFGCLLAVIFSGDTGAYITGKLFGKTKVAPTLSPKKTVEGSLGGLFFSALAGWIFSFLIPDVNPLMMIAIGFLGGFLGQIGDFFESLVKRVAGVKDSGSIMPGHGGVLDRIDGVYFASPLFYVVVSYIIMK